MTADGSLRPEESMSQARAARVHSEPEIVAHLAAHLPRWRHEDGSIRRRYDTGGWRATLMAINAVGHLAEAAWHHPEIAASYGWVEVRLSTHDAKGVTDKDFALAAKIDEVLLWSPGKEGGPLEGTPQGDPRFAYIKPN
jgi:4a-hydroxytetrahydrobiopterin dehydratase